MNFTKLKQIFTCILVLCFFSNSAWASKGTVVRATDVRQKPFLDAPSQGQLSAGSVVDIQQHNGAWLLVKSATVQGWVKLLNVRPKASYAQANPAASGASSLAGMLTSGIKGNSVTTGIKGLTSDSLENKEPNYNDIDRIHLFTIDAALAEQTAKAALLKRVDVPSFASESDVKPEIAAAAAK